MFTQWHYEASWDDVFHELPVLPDDDEVFHRIGNQIDNDQGIAVDE